MVAAARGGAMNITGGDRMDAGILTPFERQDLDLESEASICRACLGAGEWFSECCDGSRGCSCRGQVIAMGQCLACGGTGQIGDGYRASANIDSIRGRCYIGSGPQ